MPDALAALLSHVSQRPVDLALILGSGLGGIAERIQPRHCVPLASLPEMPVATVPGHDGRVILGEWAGRCVLAFAGRVHAYESHSPEEVTAAVRLAGQLGVRRLLLSNAAGGIREDLTAGTLMHLDGHLDLSRTRFWSNGVLFHIQKPTELSRALLEAGVRTGKPLAVGRYGAMLGPNYETPAEIRALRSLGVHAVGMSSSPELEAAARLGLECAAVSCITNRAAGLGAGRLSHEDVLASSRQQTARLAELVEMTLRLLPAR